MTVLGRLYELIESENGAHFSVLWDGDWLSHESLLARSNRLARGLERRGLMRGTRLALWLPNGPDWIALALACSRLGVALVALNPRLGPKEIGDLLFRTGAHTLVVSPAHRDGHARNVLASLDGGQTAPLRHIVTDEPGAPLLPDIPHTPLSAFDDEDAGPFTRGAPDDPLLILATSGTTSAPKLVVHSQERICRHMTDAARAIALTADDTSMLLGLPLCGAFGFTIAMMTLAAGRPLVLMESFVPDEAVRLVKQHRVTHMMGTDDMLHKMLAATDEPHPFPTLRRYGHANFTPSLHDFPAEVEARRVKICGAYGLSEALASVAAQPEDAPLSRRAEGGGRLVCPQAKVRIRDPETGGLATDGVAGEIELFTPNVMLGYLNDPDATARAFTADGYLRTGDLGYRLPDGSFTYLARLHDVLRIGGYLVSPAEIEEVILADEGIETCQVVAVDRPEGVRPVAFVVLRDGATLDEATLAQTCRARLALYKVPVRFIALGAMPITDGPNGAKVRKAALRDMATQILTQSERSR